MTVVLRQLVAPLGYPIPLPGRGRIKRKGALTTKSTSLNLMVRPAILRVWVRLSVDGLEASPITGITMRMSISWLKLLEL